ARHAGLEKCKKCIFNLFCKSFQWISLASGKGTIVLYKNQISVMSTLLNGTYKICTFLELHIHAILYKCIFPNQSFCEYVQFFTLFQALVRYSLKKYLPTEKEFHTKINLLVC